MDKIVIGIIGCGMVADLHISNLKSVSSIFIKWLCDIDDDQLNKSLTKHDIAGGTNDHINIANDPEVDAVIICTPPNTHYKIAKHAIKNSKHVLVEKPIATTHLEVKKFVEITKQNPSLVIMDCSARHTRLQPKYSYIKEIIASGVIGDIYHIDHTAISHKSRPGIEYHPNAKWFFDKKKSGGGPLIDWGVYDLSFHLGLLGDKPELLKLCSSVVNGLDNKSLSENNFTVEEHGIVFMEFTDGLTYHWARASNAHNEETNTTKIYGTKGGMKFSYPIWESNKIYLYSREGVCESYNIPLNGHVSDKDDCLKLDEHFIQCVLKKKKPILPFSTVAKHMTIILDSYIYRGV